MSALKSTDPDDIAESMVQMVKRSANSALTYQFDYNRFVWRCGGHFAASRPVTCGARCPRLEAGLLLSATLILLSGMIFSSAAFPRGSFGYVLLVVIVFFVLIGSISWFVVTLSVEIYRALKYAVVHKKVGVGVGVGVGVFCLLSFVSCRLFLVFWLFSSVFLFFFCLFSSVSCRLSLASFCVCVRETHPPLFDFAWCPCRRANSK